jgi:hypothetical protein
MSRGGGPLHGPRGPGGGGLKPPGWWKGGGCLGAPRTENGILGGPRGPPGAMKRGEGRTGDALMPSPRPRPSAPTGLVFTTLLRKSTNGELAGFDCKLSPPALLGLKCSGNVSNATFAPRSSFMAIYEL